MFNDVVAKQAAGQGVAGACQATLAKASSEKEGWMKSTKALQTPVGVVVQVTIQQRNADLTYSVAEALTFVPDVRIASAKNGNRYLAAMV